MVVSKVNQCVILFCCPPIQCCRVCELMWSSCRVKVFSNSDQASGGDISYPKIMSEGDVALWLSTWRFLRAADPCLYPLLILPSCASRKPDNIKLQVALRWRLCIADSRSLEKNKIFFLFEPTLDNSNTYS